MTRIIASPQGPAPHPGPRLPTGRATLHPVARILNAPLIGAMLVGALMGSTAAAQPRAPGAADVSGEHEAPAPTLLDLREIAARLEDADQDKVREAVDLLSIIDRPPVIPHLAALLRRGPPDAITDRALEALRGLGHPDCIEVLTEFTHHRRVGARRRAYRALAAINDRRVLPLLEQGLRDSERTIRAASALAIGERDASASLPILFQAFERGVVEAAIAIGKLGDAEAVGRFDQHLGQRPLSIMLSGYEHFVRRNDIPIRVKTEIVTRLGEVSGQMVRRFLAQYLDTFAARDRSPLKRLVEETLSRIPIEAATPATPAATPSAPEGDAQ